MLIFVHRNAVDQIQYYIDQLNAPGRVSEEVLQLYLVSPNRDHVLALCDQLKARDEFDHLENIHKLRPNNSLRDLTAPWRLDESVTSDYLLLVSLESVNPLFREKYPNPNLTLQAGSVEAGETARDAAVRELMEEARISVEPSFLSQLPLGLLRKGMLMYPCFIDDQSQIRWDAESSILFLS
ncbi:MAG: NUDIX domain-containing protein [Gammaproteobacteria bacterium]|nr:NUDIX domain-containing protein [Gammaproteobacteria bacterium]